MRAPRGALRYVPYLLAAVGIVYVMSWLRGYLLHPRQPAPSQAPSVLTHENIQELMQKEVEKRQLEREFDQREKALEGQVRLLQSELKDRDSLIGGLRMDMKEKAKLIDQVAALRKSLSAERDAGRISRETTAATVRREGRIEGERGEQVTVKPAVSMSPPSLGTRRLAIVLFATRANDLPAELEKSIASMGNDGVRLSDYTRFEPYLCFFGFGAL